jgi:biopolymer transport protein ExbB
MSMGWLKRPPAWRARRGLVVAFLLLAGLAACPPAAPARVQDEAGKAAAPAAPPAETAPPATPPATAADAAAPADEAPPEGGDSAAGPTSTTADPPRASMLAYLLKAHSDPLAAVVGLVLLGVSIYFVALVIRLLMEYRVSEAVPPALIEKIEGLIKDRKFQEVYDACREDNSFLARLVRTGIANLPTGRAEAKEAMNTLAEEIVVTMESRISYLATIGTLGPMIGLVGTVWGMIRSFQEIALAAGSQPRADQVASGISTALFITLEGISLSVPAIFFYAFFRNRIALIAMEATRIADRTISAFYSAAKSPGQAAAAAAAATVGAAAAASPAAVAPLPAVKAPTASTQPNKP